MTFQARFVHGSPRMVDHRPETDVAAGEVVLVGDTPHVAHLDIPAGKLGALGAGDGVYELIATGAIAAGKKVYVTPGGQASPTASGNKLFGKSLPDSSAAAGEPIHVRHAPTG